MNTPIRAIFATEHSGGMGQGDQLPWPHLSQDLKNFSSLTRNQVVIMGRKTWDSNMPTPLPKRINVVITSRAITDHSDVITVSGEPADIINQLRNNEITANLPWWIIGGAEVLRAWLPYCESVWFTQIHASFPSDVFLTTDQWQSQFILDEDSIRRVAENNISYTITNWNRK